MEFQKRTDPKWAENGTCFFYWGHDAPKCFVSRCLNASQMWDDEAASFFHEDCHGEFSDCPYVPLLWDLGKQEEVEQQEPDKEVVEWGVVLSVGETTVNIVAGFPPAEKEDEEPVALLLPCDAMLDSSLYATHSEWDTLNFKDIISKFVLPADVGSSLYIRGEDAGYDLICRCVVSESGCFSQSLSDVSDAVVGAVESATKAGINKIVIHPMVVGDFPAALKVQIEEEVINAVLVLLKTEEITGIEEISIYVLGENHDVIGLLKDF